MNRDGHEDVNFFVGPEVEHTPAFSKRTLFVVGKQPLEDILKAAQKRRTTHVFMGANRSFDVSRSDFLEVEIDKYWDETITALLDRGYWVSLDYEANLHEFVLKLLNPGIWQSRLFVPLLSVRIAKVQTSSLNLTIKIDDIDFNATNPGVWCMNVQEVTDANRFTDWLEYEGDEVLAEELIDPEDEELIDPEDTVLDNADEMGLDPNSKSVLKEELVINEVASLSALSTLNITTVEDAAAAYAEGATDNPLTDKAATKPKAKGKK